MPSTKKTSGKPQPYFESVAIVVSDRKRAAAWYTKTLGLDVLDQEEHWVTVGRKGKSGKIHLCQSTEYDETAQLEPGNSGILLGLAGKDFVADCAKLKAQGVAFVQEPKVESWGTYATIRDPDGNELTLMPTG